jgi:hypothetical protein
MNDFPDVLATSLILGFLVCHILVIMNGQVRPMFLCVLRMLNGGICLVMLKCSTMYHPIVIIALFWLNSARMHGRGMDPGLKDRRRRSEGWGMRAN